MRISFVITIYNKARYIPFILAGLSAQRGDFEREFIFIDDGSTDGSSDLLSELTRDWRNTTIIRQVNAGPALALNRGLALVRGDIIKPMDGDDVLLPGATLALMEALNSTGLAVAFGTSGVYAPDCPDEFSMLLHNTPNSSTPAIRIQNTLHQSLRHSLTNPSGWLATTEIVRKSNGSDPRIFIQDVSIEFRLARLSDFVWIETPIFLAPAGDESTRLSGNEAQILHDYNLAASHFIADFPNLPFSLRRFAVRRILGCAWKWRRRKECGSALSSREFWAFLASCLGWLPSCRESLVSLGCSTFRRTHSIRLMPQAGTGMKELA